MGTSTDATRLQFKTEFEEALTWDLITTGSTQEELITQLDLSNGDIECIENGKFPSNELLEKLTLHFGESSNTKELLNSRHFSIGENDQKIDPIGVEIKIRSKNELKVALLSMVKVIQDADDIDREQIRIFLNKIIGNPFESEGYIYRLIRALEENYAPDEVELNWTSEEILDKLSITPKWFLDTEIDTLGLSNRIINVFKLNDIKVIRDISNYGFNRLAKTPNLGLKSLHELSLLLVKKMHERVR